MAMQWLDDPLTEYASDLRVTLAPQFGVNECIALGAVRPQVKSILIAQTTGIIRLRSATLQDEGCLCN